MVLIAILANVRRVWIPPVLFSCASFYMWMLVKHAPQLKQINTQQLRSGLRFPYSLDELRDLSSLLQLYQTEYWHYTLLLFSSAYLFKQTFSIPGSVFLNMLSGALYGAVEGGLLCCLLSAIGASFCHQLSDCCCRHLLAQLFPARIQLLTSKVHRNRHQMLSFLLFIRLFPVTPNWFVNVASPIVGVPLNLFAISVFIGLLPYNFICSHAGSLLSQLSSIDDLFSRSTLFLLVAMALVALLPTIYQSVRRHHLVQSRPSLPPQLTLRQRVKPLANTRSH